MCGRKGRWLGWKVSEVGSDQAGGGASCSPPPVGAPDAGQSKINVKLDDGKGIVTVDLKAVKELYTVNPKTKCASFSAPLYAPTAPVQRLTHPGGLPSRAVQLPIDSASND